MIFNEHSRLAGMHAFLSASNYHWTDYDSEKLERVYRNHRAAQLGTVLHELASDLINLNQHLPNEKKTLNMFVNDAIDFGMSSEKVLFFSENFFGTTDAISFDEDTGLLRISDLKTGVTKSSMKQLMVYAALFCLEYEKDPYDLTIELRIYQNDEVQLTIPDPRLIETIMVKGVESDRIVRTIEEDIRKHRK